MIVMRTLSEVKANAPEQIAKEVEALLHQLLMECPTCEMSADAKGDSLHLFEWALGGYIYLVETYEDLKQIGVLKGVDEYDNIIDWLSEESVRDANITESVGEFDGADYLAPDGQYAALFLATNNAGGNVYYISRQIADQCANIEASIRLQHGGGIAFHSSRIELSDTLRVEMPDGTIKGLYE